MPKKLTIEFVRKQFDKDGYTLLTKKYINNRQNLDYICPENHIETITWGNFGRGRRCSECSGNKKLTIEFIKKQFEKEGYKLLAEEYVNNYTPLSYICPKGDRDEIRWKDWQKGSRCAKCAGLKKLTIKFICEQFEREGYTLLSKKYVNSKTSLEYICPKGDYGTTIWSKWQQGYRCKKCFHENNRGNNNSRWNPNLTNEDRVNGRKIPGYKEWSYAVKEKDNFTCQVCGDNSGGNLVSHHFCSYHNNRDLRTVLANGVCLCEKCHNLFHKTYGRKNNTREQFEKFKNILWYAYCICF